MRSEPGERRAIIAVLTWLVLSLVVLGFGYQWMQDHGGGTDPDPINVGTAQVGVCQEKWSGVWRCEMVSATWGPGPTPRARPVHAGRDVSGRTVDVAWRDYSRSRDGDTIIMVTGPGAPIGNVAIFIFTPLTAAFSVGVAGVLVMIGRFLNWVRRRRTPPASRPSETG